MDAQEQEYDMPVIDSWRQAPTVAQRRFAVDLCRTELKDPKPTLARIPVMSRREMSALIDDLKTRRAKRRRRAPRNRSFRLTL